MKRSKRLEPVVRVAENRKQQAAKALGESQSALQQAEQRLDELKNYREEYIRRFHTNGAQGMSAVQMGDYRLFLSNLSRAIEQQVELVNQAAAVKMLDKVVSRFQADEQRIVDKKEQLEQDERAQRLPKSSR